MGVGLTAKQQRALDAIVTYVALHGAAPSLASLGEALGCNRNNARQHVMRLIERGSLTRMPDGSLALGSGGVMVNVPRYIAAKLASFCAANGEQVSAVIADAVALHIDDIEGGGHDAEVATQ